MKGLIYLFFAYIIVLGSKQRGLRMTLYMLKSDNEVGMIDYIRSLVMDPTSGLFSLLQKWGARLVSYYSTESERNVIVLIEAPCDHSASLIHGLVYAQASQPTSVKKFH